MVLHSRFADADAARRAVAFAQPAIEAALRLPEISGLGVLHIVVLDPVVTPSVGTFDQALLFEHSIGERERWDADYQGFARAKARLSWRHGMDSRRLQLLEPHRLDANESLLWGGVHVDGIVVAASGAMPAWDEAFAFSVAGYLRSIACERAEAARGQR